MDKLYIVMPAYNEQENIEAVVREWYPVLDGKDQQSRLVVADSGSTDCTHQILTDLKKKYPKIEILSETGKQHGPKLLALYDYAAEAGADYVFQTDSDGQTSVAEFDIFWKQREKYDAIIGNRVVRGDGLDRKLIEMAVCWLLWVFFKVNIPDANAPFRLMKIGMIQKYIYGFPEDYSLPNIMMTTLFAYYHENIKFEQISFKKRGGGVNSINLPKIIRTGWKAIKDWNIRSKKMKEEGRYD